MWSIQRALPRTCRCLLLNPPPSTHVFPHLPSRRPRALLNLPYSHHFILLQLPYRNTNCIILTDQRSPTPESCHFDQVLSLLYLNTVQDTGGLSTVSIPSSYSSFPHSLLSFQLKIPCLIYICSVPSISSFRRCRCASCIRSSPQLCSLVPKTGNLSLYRHLHGIRRPELLL